MLPRQTNQLVSRSLQRVGWCTEAQKHATSELTLTSYLKLLSLIAVCCLMLAFSSLAFRLPNYDFTYAPPGTILAVILLVSDILIVQVAIVSVSFITSPHSV